MNQRQGTLFILLSTTGYSFFSIWVKQIQASGIVALDIAFWRFLLAVPIFWLVIRLLKGSTPDKPLPRLKLMLTGTLFTVAALTAFLALERLPVSTFIVLVYTFPAMVTILSFFLGERLPPVGWIALVLTLVGVALTVPDFNQNLSGDNIVGVLLALLNALSVAAYYILSSRLMRDHSGTTRASAWTVTGALIPMLVIAPLTTPVVPNSVDTWVSILGLVLVSTTVPVFFLNAGIQKIGPTQSSILGTLEPVLTLIWAALFLGERLLPIQLVGGLLIFTSVILLQVSNLRRKTAPLVVDVGVS